MGESLYFASVNKDHSSAPYCTQFRISIIISVLAILPMLGFSQEDQIVFPILSPEQQQMDQDSLQQWLLRTHVDGASLLREMDSTNLPKVVRVNNLSPQESNQFLRSLLPVFQLFNDSHTQIWLPVAADPYYLQGGYYLPLQVQYCEDRWSITSDQRGTIPPGSEPVSIAGHRADSLFTQLTQLQIIEGEKTNKARELLSTNFMTRLSWLLPLDSLVRLEIRLPDGRDSLLDYPALRWRDYARPNADSLPARPPWAFAWLDSLKEVGYLQVSSFSAGKRRQYRRFLRRQFCTLQQADSPYLIIDLRNNGGGYLHRSYFLLRHLLDSTIAYPYAAVVRGSPLFRDDLRRRTVLPGVQAWLFPWALGPEMRAAWRDRDGQRDTVYYPPLRPVPRRRQFDGQVILLTNALTMSSAGLITLAARQHDLATIIGTAPMVTTKGTYGNAVPFSLPVSHLRGSIATMHIFPDPAAWERPPTDLQPDYKLMPACDLQGDAPLEFARKLIAEWALATSASSPAPTSGGNTN